MPSDPARIAPRLVKVALENEKVRVLRVTLGPNDVVPLHSHPSAVGIFLSPVHLENTEPLKSAETVRARAGEVRWFPPVTHTTQNRGPHNMEMLIVELKSPPLA
jgi:beta-alanine degradation protein BauB